MDTKAISRAWPWLAISGVLGLLFFFYRFGVTPVNPFQMDWLLAKNDAAFHFLGWQYYRLEGWHWPPGNIDNYYAPAGASIALTDSIPLVGMFFKVFAPLLPMPFQYFGWWLCLSYVLQAVFGFLLMSALTNDRRISLAGACMFLIAPAFLNRNPHIALASHWLILAALWMNLNAAELNWKIRSIRWFLLITMSAGTHAYLCFTVLALFFADMAGRAWTGLKEDFRFYAASVVAMGCWTLFVWYCCGFFVGRFGGNGNPPFGMYSLNLNAFLNSGGHSLFVPRLPWYGSSQFFESFAYLGVGILVLGMLCIVTVIPKVPKFRLKRRWLPLTLVIAVMTLFSVSNSVTWNNHEIFRIPLLAISQGVLGILYCSCRFIWPLYYLITAYVFASVPRLFRWNWLAVSIAVCCVAVQFVELNTLADKRDYMAKLQPEWKARASELDDLLPHFERVATVPMSARELSKGWDYAGVAYRESFQPHPFFLGGNVARKPYRFLKAVDESLETKLVNDTADPKTLYVFNAPEFYKLYPRMADRFDAALVGGYFVAFSKGVKVSVSCRIAVTETSMPALCNGEISHDGTIVVSGEDTDWVQKNSSVKGCLAQLPPYEKVDAITCNGLNTGPTKGDLAIGCLDGTGRIEKVALTDSSGTSWLFSFDECLETTTLPVPATGQKP